MASGQGTALDIAGDCRIYGIDVPCIGVPVRVRVGEGVRVVAKTEVAG